MKVVFLLSAWLLLPSVQAQPPPPRFLPLLHHYSVEQGLTNRFVRDVFQDSRGFVWLSTHFGLSRFDGHAFVSYTAQSHGLHSNVIAAVREDPDGWLWVFQLRDARVHHLQLLDPRTGRVQAFEEHFPGCRLPFDLRQLADHRGVQDLGLLFTEDGTCFHYLGHGRFARRRVGVPAPNVLQTTRQGTFLAPYLHDDGAPPYFRELDPTGGVRRASGQSLSPIWSLKPGQPLWLTVPAIPGLHLRRFHDAAREREWYLDVATRRLEVRRPDGTPLHDFSPQLAQFEGWQSLYSVLLDRTGSLWLATSGGVIVLDLSPNRFETLLQQPASVSERWVSARSLHRVGDTLWVNSQSGLYRVALPTRKTEQLTHQGVYAQLFDRRGNLWLGGPTLTVFRAGRLPPRTFKLRHPDVWALAEGPLGLLWLGTEHGLTRFDTRQNHEVDFAGYGGFGELAAAKITAFQPDPDGGYWVCASTGLYRLDLHAGRISDRYHAGGDKAHRLPFDFFHDICPDRREAGVYWLATKGAGLVRWHRPSGKTRVFARTEGLSNEVLHAVYDDDRGGLWLPSDRGLMRFDKQSLTVRAFYGKDGLAHDEFNLTAHHQASDGRLYFGGLNGVTVFHPADFYGEKTESPPPLAVASLRQQDARTGLFSDQSEQFWQENRVELSPGERTAELSVCLADFRQPGYHTFAYRLRGLQETWVYQPTNVVTLSGLPPGSYTLEIKAQNSLGRWTGAPLQIAVRMLPPVYLRGWFLLATALVLAGATWGGHLYRTKTLRRENEHLEAEVAVRTAKIQQQADELRELDRLKSHFFANVSHELRTPLTLVLGSLGAARRDRSPDERRQALDVADRNASALLRQVNHLLDLNRLEARRMERHDAVLSLGPFLKRVMGQFESQARYLGLTLRLDDHTPTGQEVYLDADKLETILVNLLSNALKYTSSGGHVGLRVERLARQLQLVVTDTGRGIHPDDLPRIFERFFQTSRPDVPAEGGSGIGLSLVKELCAFLGGTLAVRSEVGVGSEFDVRLPLAEGAETPNGRVPATTDVATPLPVLPEPLPLLPSPGLGASRPTVLVVEDHPDMRAYLVDLLRDEFAVETEPDGLRAYERLRGGFLPDLILSDRMMPGLDGLQLLEKLRAEPDLPLLPFVMLTARVAETDRLEALRVGVDDYLSKPFSADELRARVRNLIENAHRRRAYLTQMSASEPDDTPTAAEAYSLEWLKKAEVQARRCIPDPRFGVGDLADFLALSERQLTRRLRSLTGLSPNQFLQEIRLQATRELLLAQPGIGWKQLSLTVGFQRPDYLRKLYFERFGGGTPSD